MVESSFRIMLVNDPAVNGIVQGRIYHNVRPSDERRDCIVMQRVSTFFARKFGGGADTTKGRIQVDCFSESYPAVKTLAEKVRTKLDQFTGTVDGVKFYYIEVEDERDLPAAPLAGRTTPLFGVSIDTRFLFRN